MARRLPDTELAGPAALLRRGRRLRRLRHGPLRRKAAEAPPDDRELPDLSFAFYDRMVIFDHINKTIAVVAHAHVSGVGKKT